MKTHVVCGGGVRMKVKRQDVPMAKAVKDSAGVSVWYWLLMFQPLLVVVVVETTRSTELPHRFSQTAVGCFLSTFLSSSVPAELTRPRPSRSCDG